MIDKNNIRKLVKTRIVDVGREILTKNYSMSHDFKMRLSLKGIKFQSVKLYPKNG